ncbi:DUF2066 domain-containing protein [Glaciecola sp. XM2]|uniref:DUF2066 domain-containing protein n=1 Tax=Glaciecola sp. XM2 TaxID=1914931 RepID=UPI0033267872
MKTYFFVLLLVLSLSHGAFASKVDSINIGRVAVDNQSLSTQTAAGREALRQVFVKMSGSKDTLSHPGIRRSVSNYEDYLVSSTFLQEGDQLWLQATFNEQLIERELRSAGQPIWANLRPDASMWIAIETDTAAIEWLHQNNAQGFDRQLAHAAFERGVNVVLPLGDLSDSMAVTAFDVWTQNISKLSMQTPRYETDFFINVSVQRISADTRLRLAEQQAFIEQQKALDDLFNAVAVDEQTSKVEALLMPSDSDQLQVDWVISGDNTIDIGKSYIEDASQIAQVVIDVFADKLAQQYATGGGLLAQNLASNNTIVVSNIRSLTDYHKAQTLIAAIPQVNTLNLRRIEGERAFFDVTLSGEIAEFVSLITLDPRMSRLAEQQSEQSLDAIQLVWEL